MVVDAKDLEKLLTSLLRPVAFRREGRNWRLDLSDVIQVVNLQRSRWSDSFYLNIGIFVRAVQNEPGRVRSEAKPNIVECHFRIRLEDLFTGPPVPPTKISAEQIRLHELLNLEDRRIGPATREAELRSMIEQRMLPFLELCRTEAGILSSIQRKVVSGYMLYWILRDRLGLTPP
jgi:hypothetical protein